MLKVTEIFGCFRVRVTISPSSVSFCIFSSMKWIPVFLLCLMAGLPGYVEGQHLPDFSEAVDPAELDPGAVFFHLDTARQYRKPVRLDFVRQEFAPDVPVEMETFYQKSAHHTLLRLGKISFTPANLFAMTEGSGHTFIKMTDGVCTVITRITVDPVAEKPAVLTRNCTL